MNLVCLDTHYFIWGILLKATLGQEDRITQATEFFRWLNETNAIIIVPTPIITELLMGSDVTERHKILTELESKFRIAEFDVLSAKLAADIWNKKKSAGVIDELAKSGASIRTKLKIDTQILAIAMGANATVLYTEDKDLRTLAEGFIITRTMPIQSQGELFKHEVSPTDSVPPPVQSPPAPEPKSSQPPPSLPSDIPVSKGQPPPDSSPSLDS